MAALDRTALRPLPAGTRAIQAVLLEPPRRSQAGGRYALARLAAGPGHGETVLLRAGRRTRWPVVPVGAILAARVRFVPLGEWDGRARRLGAHAVAIANALRATGRSRGGVSGALDAARERAQRALASGLDPPRAALLRGMVLGQDEALSEAERDRFRRSGLAHLLAASGQNVALLAALVLPLLTAAGVGLRVRLTVVLGLIAAYVPLAGGGPSIQRAGVMGAAALAAGLAGRPASRAYALLLAAAVTLAASPRAAEDPGWQLSFAAVVAILALGPPLRRALRARRVPGAVADAAAMTVAATLGTAPLLAIHFGRVSLVSVGANLAAAPAVAPIMWLGMVSAAAGQAAPALAVLPNALAQFPLAYLQAVAAAPRGSRTPPWRPGPPSPGCWRAPAPRWPLRLSRRGAGGAAAPVRCWLPERSPPRWRRAPSGPGRPGPAGGPGRLFPGRRAGDATLIQHGARAILVDTGPPGAPVLGELRDAGAARLDVLVVTHAQADHEGNAASVLRHVPVGLLLDGGEGATPERRAILAAAQAEHVPRAVPDAGQVLHAGPLELRILWPRHEDPALHAGIDPNDRAIVAILRDGAFDLYLSADAESNVAAALDLPQVDAMKVAHHGSDDPGLPDLLARLRPQIAAIEVGAHNTYGHPVPATLAALRAVPQVFRTDRDGTVRVKVTGATMTVARGP
ncbi:MAG: ComEC/Rec2 family competence protein [Solirubrobacteraceae bacterium]